MENLKEIFDFFLHLDVHLQKIIHDYGIATYIILFAIIFIETGLVIMPFLPGDSLLFAAGAFAALGAFNIYLLIALLFIAAVIGDSLNYYLGKNVGLKVLQWKIGNIQLVKPHHIKKTQVFYEKHGAKTIILARFVPLVRTFAPFVAGVGQMNYSTFIFYNVVGGAIWVVSLTLAGYFFGNLPIVKENFETVIMLIILVSVLPLVVKALMQKFQMRSVNVNQEMP